MRSVTQFHRAQLLAPATTYRRKPLPLATNPIQQLRRPPKQGQTQLSTSRSRTVQDLRLFSLRLQKITEYVPHRSQERKASSSQSHSPQNLMWRRAVPPNSPIAENSRRFELSDPFQRPSIPSTPILEEKVSVLRPIEPMAVGPVTKLDPALVERLADDVIRRMDQRVRIERQRRGL